MTKRINWLLGLGLSLAVLIVFVFAEDYMNSKRMTLQRISESEEIVLGANLSDYINEMGLVSPLNNQDVVRVLTGENRKGKVFIDKSTLRLNQDGEAIDPTGQPYEFTYSDGYPKVSSPSLKTSMRDVTKSRRGQTLNLDRPDK